MEPEFLLQRSRQSATSVCHEPGQSATSLCHEPGQSATSLCHEPGQSSPRASNRILQDPF